MPGDQERYKQYISMGHTYAWDLDWEQAVEQYRLALEEFPESIQAISSLAAAYFELGQLDHALKSYRQVAEKKPDDPLVLEKIAQILELQGQRKAGAEVALLAAELHLKSQDMSKALENWTRTISLDPGNLRARSRLALTYERQKQLNQAVTHYLIVASLLQHGGNKERAIEVMQHALKLDPNNSEANQALGLLRANQSLPRPQDRPPRRDALPAGKKTRLPELETTEEQPENRYDPVEEAERRALSVLAELMFEQADASENGRAGRTIQTIAQGTGPLNRMQAERTRIMLHLSQAVDLQSRGHGRQAIEELERAVEAGLDQSAVFFDIGLLKYQNGNLEGALPHLVTAVKHPEFTLASRLLRGKIYQKLERHRESVVEYLEALRWADSSVVHSERSAALRQVYENIIASYPREGDPQAYQKLSKSIVDLVWRKDWRDKIRQARQQLAQQPPELPPLPLVELLTETENTLIVEMLGRIHQLAREGRYRMAMEEAFLAIDISPTYLPLHSFMGEILMQQDRIPEAISKFNTVARAYSARGEANRSVELFRRITRLAPLNLSARQRLIEQLTASGLTEETIQEYLDLGDVYYRLAELDKARDTYQRALNLAQQSEVSNDWTVEILHHLADIDIQRLDWPRALRIFEQIARIKPGDKKSAMGLVDLNLRLADDTAAMASMGNYIAFLNRDSRQHEALESLEELLNNNPDQLAIKRSLAEQYQLVGNREKAIEAWEEVGEAMAEARNIQGAIQAYEAILSLNPGNRSEYEQKLALYRDS